MQQKNKFLSLLYVIVAIILVLIAFPYIYKLIVNFVQSIKEKNTNLKLEQNTFENQIADPIIQRTKANAITLSLAVQNAANEIAKDLGTSTEDVKSFFGIDFFGQVPSNIGAYTENDTKVANNLILYRNNLNSISKLYNKVYTNNRNLKNDILKLLDNDQLSRLRKFTKYF